MTAAQGSEPPKEKPDAKQLLREFYPSRGIDIDQPMQKTIRRITWEEKNRDHEQWHRELDAFLKQRDSPTDYSSTTTTP